MANYCAWENTEQLFEHSTNQNTEVGFQHRAEYYILLLIKRYFARSLQNFKRWKIVLTTRPLALILCHTD